MKICLAIPVHNEVAQLETNIGRLINASEAWTAFDLEVVIANNGSTDGTTEIAERLSAGSTKLRHERLEEKGRGRALRKVWRKSAADVLAYMDVDLSTDLSFFPRLVAPLILGQVDISVASRLLCPRWTKRDWKREFISRSYNKLLKWVFSPSFSDAQCGFKAISRSAADALLPLVQDDAWFFDTELLLLAEHLGYRIYDLPVRWEDDTDSRVRIIPTIIDDLKGVLRLRRRLISPDFPPARQSRKQRSLAANVRVVIL